MPTTKEFFRKRLTAQLGTGAAASASALVADADSLVRIADDREFLRAAYRAYLGRDADISGLAHHLESLRSHVPRRVVLARIAESDEARARHGGVARPAADPPREGLIARIRRGASVRARDLARQLILSRFDSIDYKLDFVLEEMAARLNAISEKNEAAVAGMSATLSAKTDDYFAESWRRQRESEAALTGAIEDLRTRLGETRRSAEDAVRSAESLLSGRIDEIERRIGTVSARLYPPAISGGNVIATEVHGFIIGVPKTEWRMAAYHAMRGPLEPGLTRFFEATVRPGMIVADVGANVGFFTLLAARLTGGQGRVHSFEPTPATAAILEDNVQVNGFRESGIVAVHRQAVSARRGNARLTVFENDSGHNTLYWPGGNESAVEVETVTLDEALAAEPRVDFVKIDTEGAEPAVLAGMDRILAANPSIRIAVEFAPSNLHRAGCDPVEFLNRIRAMGLGWKRIDDLTGEPREAGSEDLAGCFSANLLLERSAL
ncbi:MAG: FkbM family methyltransferase [Bryobacteraceae bacterium]